ncbi:MAG: 4-(cytidine 5'-diphospho)-2-C-methyl-D-erythritol kinase [Pseudomonadota bacterium]
MLTAFAPAKINLFLHVLSRRADGYHTLESLVTFADVGDTLTLDPSKPLSLMLSGPFAAGCSNDEHNLVLKAARNLSMHVAGLKTGAFTLEKNLPVGAGIGGGSADAAAALRLLSELNGLELNDARVKQAALNTGADVPVCLTSQTALMRGIGEEIEQASFPALHAVLVNGGKALATRDVFEALTLQQKEKKDFSSLLRDFPNAISWLSSMSNDLEKPAEYLCPQVSTVRQALEKSGAQLIRMTGSGATVFGLYENTVQAQQAATQLRKENPRWWIKDVTLGSKL